MMKDWKYSVILICALYWCSAILAQAPPSSPVRYGHSIPAMSPLVLSAGTAQANFVIGDIYIKGNRVTKNYIIERELSFKKGDSLTLHDLVIAFEKAHDRLINTHLFNEAVVYLKESRGVVMDIEIEVKERWYIFPLPYFRPVDRNLSVWQENNYSLSRVNYGVKYTHYNFTGRNDNLIAWLITGYSRQVELAYDQPYADKALRHGFGFTAIFAALREVNAATVANKQYFIRSDTFSYAKPFLSEQFSFSLRYYYRPALRTRHLFRLGLTKISIDSAVQVTNPAFFSNNVRQLIYPEFFYVLNYTDVDYLPYPLRGLTYEAGFLRRGIKRDMNLWQVYFKSSLSWPIAHKTYFTTQNWSLLKLPFHQPFYNQQLMGYGDFYLRGLDKYVVDGVAALMVHNTFMRELFNFNIPFLHVASHDHIPFRIYATAFGDAGYASNQNNGLNNAGNSLENRFLYTGGVGVDIVSFYDFTFKLDYSFNQLGQKGLFLRIGNEF